MNSSRASEIRVPNCGIEDAMGTYDGEADPSAPSDVNDKAGRTSLQDMSSVEMSEDVVFPRPEWGRHGSPRAHTLGKRSHGLQEGF